MASFLWHFCYAFNDVVSRKDLWRDLAQIQVMQNAWVWMGDFNNELDMEDRLGAPMRANEFIDFRRCMEQCSMEDMKATRCFYTWNNKQEAESRIFTKIERVMYNSAWLEAYPFTKVHFHPEGEFDHSPTCDLDLIPYP